MTTKTLDGRIYFNPLKLRYKKPFTEEWWRWLIENDLTEIKPNDIKSYNYTMDEIDDIIKNYKKRTRKEIIEAFFTFAVYKGELTEQMESIRDNFI
jgi:hypothetical protein